MEYRKQAALLAPLMICTVAAMPVDPEHTEVKAEQSGIPAPRHVEPATRPIAAFLPKPRHEAPPKPEPKPKPAPTPTPSPTQTETKQPTPTDISMPVSGIQALARTIVGDASFACFDDIVERESSWDVHAESPEGAYGLGQALPADKMASYGPDWQDDPTTQIRWALAYIRARYGSPCAAWSFWQAHSWY